MILFEIIFDIFGDLLLELVCLLLGAIFAGLFELFTTSPFDRGPQIQSLFAKEMVNRAGPGGVR